MTHSKGGYALLTKRERGWIVGKISVSKTIERDIRYRIRKKLEILCNEELPLLMDRGLFGHNKDNVSYRPDGYVFPFDTCSVVANNDGVAPNNDSCNASGRRWSSMVKIPPLTMRNIVDNAGVPAEIQTKTITQNTKWAGSDLNQRPPPCQG